MQVVSTLCDQCHDIGDETAAVETVVIQVNRKATELDLCQAHIDDLDMRLDEHFRIGRRPGNINVVVDRKGKAAGDFACDRCTRSFPTLQGLSMHRTRTHKVLSQTTEAIRKRERDEGATLPPGMTYDEAQTLLDSGHCIYDPSHGPFKGRSGAGSHLRDQHNVSLMSLGVGRPPGSKRATG